jgi:adenylosuccinate synthase
LLEVINNLLYLAAKVMLQTTFIPQKLKKYTEIKSFQKIPAWIKEDFGIRSDTQLDEKEEDFVARVLV